MTQKRLFLLICIFLSVFNVANSKPVQAETASVVYQDFSYTFDPHKPNLLSRKDKTRNINEDFVYDGFDRLTGFGNETVTYDEKGNITEKSDVGTYEYDHPDKPYAVTDVLTAENAVSVEPQNITYTSFLRPNRISEGNITAQFAYNAAADRVKMSVTDNDKTVLVRYYLGNCYELEIDGNNSKETLYLSGDYYSAPAALVKYGIFADTGTADSGTSVGLNGIGMEEPSIDFDDTGEDMPNSELYFIMRDYLGSITHIISASTGKIVQELSYDAWGRLRDPATQQIYPQGTEPPLFLGRGYTGHEHLPWFGLINMNARLYDPVLGRFLSPDPFVQNSDWLQNYNRYSYALNNPLCYIDEDGQFFWIAVGVGAALSGIINVATHWDDIASAGGWKGFWKGLGYFGVGAVAGGVGTAVSIGAAVGVGGMMGLSSMVATSGFVSGVSSGAAGGAVSGFLTEFSNSLIEGEGFETALNNGLSGSASGAILGGLLNGTVSGIKAVQNGRDFWSGKITVKNLIQKAANKAEANIGGKGHVAGTKKHTYVNEILKRYESMYGKKNLGYNPFRKDEDQIKRILDIYHKRLEFEFSLKVASNNIDFRINTNVIYDLKFGYPNLTPAQLNQTRQMIIYRKTWHAESIIIKPNKL